MRILIITQKVDKNDSTLGFFHRWVEEFSKQCEFVYVVCLYKGESNLPDNVNIMSLGKEEGESRFKYIWRFYKYSLPLIFGRRINKIFIHMNEIYVALLIPARPMLKILGIDLLWWKAHVKINQIAKFLRFFVDRVLTSGERSFSIKSKNRRIIGQGIDTDFFRPADESVRKANQIIAVGRAAEIKGYDLMVDAATLLRERGVNFSLDLVGTRSKVENRYFEKILKKIEEE